MRRLALVCLLFVIPSPTAEAQEKPAREAPAAPSSDAVPGPTNEELERVLLLAQNQEHLVARIKALTTAEASTRLLLERTQKELAAAKAKEHGQHALSGLGLRLLRSQIRLLGDQHKRWQSEQLLSIGRKSPKSREAALEYLKALASERERNKAAILERAVALRGIITDPGLLEGLKKRRPALYVLLRPTR